MADTTTVVEGRVKFRDGKKWKQRWCVLKKPSPVADRLQVLLYKDVKDAIRDGRKPKSTFFVENYYGLVSGFSHDKENTVMAVLCQKQVALFAFETLDLMIQFEIKIRHSLGEEHQFPVTVVKVPPNSRLPLDKVTLMIQGQRFCLVAHVPPRVLQAWHISDLRRFGAVDGKFCFEGGSRCGKGSGVHALQSDQSEDLANLVRLGSLGRTSTSLRNAPNKRGSQLCEPFHLVGPGLYNGSHKTPDHRLSCCQEGQEAGDNWTWHKRHSISVTDYNRVGGQIEKLRLQSTDSIERQRLMAIYDIPPKLVRKVEAACARGGTTLARISDDFSQESGGETMVSTAAIKLDVSKVPPAGGRRQSSEQETTSEEEPGKSSEAPQRGPIRRNSHTKSHWEKTPDRFYGQGAVELGVIESEVRMAFDKSKRKEALQKLQQEESDLQREISLLDEILQVCRFDEDPTRSGRSGVQVEEGRGEAKQNDSARTKASSLPPRPRVDIVVELPSSKAAAHGDKTMSDFILSDDLESVQSPNLLGKLQNIPPRSKLLEPLPYVNLSQFDSDDLSSHVHIPGSREALHHLGTSTSSLDKYTPGKKETLATLGCRSSSESHIAHAAASASARGSKAWEKERERKQEQEREPIYANQSKPKSDPPPPELPPKGPALLRKNRQKSSSTRDRSGPPPLPARNRSRSAGSASVKVPGYDSPPPLPARPLSTLPGGAAPPHPPLPSSSQPCPLSQVPPACNSPSPRQQPQDSYFEMGNFVQEPKNFLRALQSKLSPASAFQAQSRPSSKVQSTGSPITRRGNADVLCYMDMSGQFEREPTYMEPVLPAESAGKTESIPEETKPAVLIDMTVPSTDRHVYAQVTDAENNYMEMRGPKRRSGVLENLKTLQTYVSTTPAGETGGSSHSSSGSTSSQASGVDGDSTRPAMPFPNLLRFEERLRPSAYVNTVVNSGTTGAGVTNSGDSFQSSSSVQSSPKPPSHSSKKEEGFLARFKRRNSRDQKAASQSQENLISNKNNRSSFLERSLSEQAQPSTPKETKEGGLRIGRQRSSSFPNRLSYQESSGEPGKAGGGSSSQGRSSVSSVSSLSSISPPPKRTSRMSTALELVEDPSQESSDDTTPLLKDAGPEPEMRVLTVLHVQEEVKPPPLPERCFRRNLSFDSSKTDDEKLMELFKMGKSPFPFESKLEDADSKDFRSKLSLDVTVPVSPSQKASEIARHVASLPPFIPPKAKPYPAMLSPVMEVMHLSPSQSEAESIYVEMKERPRGSPTETSASAPATLEPEQLKSKAQTTLQVSAPPEEEEELGFVWVPQASPGGSGSGPSPSPSASAEGAPAGPWRDSLEQQALHSGPLVVSVEDVRQAAEADGGDSIVSLESLDAISICSEGTIPCGPGTTTLRPRSGREYQVVERRRTPSDSCASSPHTPQTPQTPYSPSSVAYVFTFDSTSTSGALAACPHVESNSACTCPHTPRSHLPSVSSEVPTPHTSQVPKSPGLLPIEQAEPQLNYAVIDLTSVPKDKVKKRHKVQRAATIEYAKIDMVATRAVQKAAQHREDTLRRSHSAVCGSHPGTSSLRKNSVHLQSRHERRTMSTSVASTSGTQRETRPSTSSLEPS